MLTRSDFSEFKKDFKKAIKDVEDKYNIDISINRITYSDIMFKMTLEAISKELECSVEEMKFKEVCAIYGLPEESYGTVVTINNDEYKLVGISPRARKYPITMERCRDGEKYGFSSSIREQILKQFEKNK